MKTLNRVVSADQNARLTLLNWGGEAVSSQFAQTIRRPKFARPSKSPVLWVVPSGAKVDLFNYARATNSRSGFWEGVVFAVLGISAVAALAIAFLGV